MRAYFDTEGNVSKNIDIGTLELDGSVMAVPEPGTLGIIVGVGLATLAQAAPVFCELSNSVNPVPGKPGGRGEYGGIKD